MKLGEIRDQDLSLGILIFRPVLPLCSQRLAMLVKSGTRKFVTLVCALFCTCFEASMTERKVVST